MTIHGTQRPNDQNLQAYGVQDTPAGSWEQRAALPESQQLGDPDTATRTGGSMDFVKQLMQLLMSFKQLIMTLPGGLQGGRNSGAEEPQGIKKGQAAGVTDQYGEMPIQTGEEESL